MYVTFPWFGISFSGRNEFRCGPEIDEDEYVVVGCVVTLNNPRD